MRAGHRHHYFICHRSEKVTVSEVTPSGRQRAAEPQSKAGPSAPEHAAAGIPEPRGRFPTPPALARAPLPGAWRPETTAWRLGADSRAGASQKLCRGRNLLRAPQSPEVSGSGRVPTPPWELRFQRHLTSTPGPGARGLGDTPCWGPKSSQGGMRAQTQKASLLWVWGSSVCYFSWGPTRIWVVTVTTLEILQPPRSPKVQPVLHLEV